MLDAVNVFFLCRSRQSSSLDLLFNPCTVAVLLDHTVDHADGACSLPCQQRCLVSWRDSKEVRIGHTAPSSGRRVRVANDGGENSLLAR